MIGCVRAKEKASRSGRGCEHRAHLRPRGPRGGVPYRIELAPSDPRDLKTRVTESLRSARNEKNSGSSRLSSQTARKIRRGMMASLSGGLASVGAAVPYAIVAGMAPRSPAYRARGRRRHAGTTGRTGVSGRRNAGSVSRRDREKFVQAKANAAFRPQALLPQRFSC